MKTSKCILKKSIWAGTDPHLAILDYRNTPTQGMTTSPAQCLMSRSTKTLLPTTQSILLPRTIDLEVEKKELRQRQQAQAKYYNRSAKDLPSLSEGNVVRMKPFKLGDKLWRKARVTARLGEWSYSIDTDDGAVYHRNQQHLQKMSEPSVEPIITAPEPDMASAVDKATTIAASTPNQSNAPHEPHPEVVTFPEQCRRSEQVRKSPAYLKDYVCD